MPPMVDIWFGPGAIKGVFGAGVAFTLQQAFERGEMDRARVRLFGSSVGCLTAAFLATGNTHCGLAIFQEDTRQLILRRNLVPSVGARVLNGMAGLVRRGRLVFPVPVVLNVPHVFQVLARRTPDLPRQLRAASLPVFAECVDPSGRVHHRDLRTADDPLAGIRASLNAYPFTSLRETTLLDSAIGGYGFVELLRARERPLVAVLNSPPGYTAADALADYMCASLCGNRAIAALYVRRRRNQDQALRLASELARHVLVVAPESRALLRSARDFELAHQAGRQAAERIVDFVHRHA